MANKRNEKVDTDLQAHLAVLRHVVRFDLRGAARRHAGSAAVSAVAAALRAETGVRVRRVRDGGREVIPLVGDRGAPGARKARERDHRVPQRRRSPTDRFKHRLERVVFVHPCDRQRERRDVDVGGNREVVRLPRVRVCARVVPPRIERLRLMRRVPSKMLGGASQIVRRIRVKCNGKRKLT